MKNFQKILGILSLLMFTSCGLFQRNLAKRYSNSGRASLFANASRPQSFVQVESHSHPLDEPATNSTKLNVMSLSDRGQEAFIQAADNNTTDSKTLMNLLNSNFNFSKDDKPSVKYVSKTIKKSIVFTVNKQPYYNNNGSTIFNYPGDRIAYLELTLQLPDAAPARFNSWDKYVSDLVTLNLGKATSSEKWNASLNLSAKAGGEVALNGSNGSEGSTVGTDNNSGTLINGGLTSINGTQVVRSDKGTSSTSTGVKGTTELGGTGTVGYENSYETSLDLTQRILKLSGTLADSKMILRQEGGPYIDLSGNVSVAVEYQLTNDWAAPVRFVKLKDMYDNDGNPQDAIHIKKTVSLMFFPDLKESVTGNLDYSFLYRQIQNGSKHLPEARHRVKFWFGDVKGENNELLNKKPVILVNKEDVRPKSYNIMSGAELLMFDLHTSLQFETMSEAATFIQYLTDARLAGKAITRITIGGTGITDAQMDGLQIVTNQH